MDEDRLLDEDEYLPLSIDLIGAISTAVGSLKGPDTLLFELLQNADDSKRRDGQHASEVAISINSESLDVWNDGEFTECVDIRAPRCLLAEGQKHWCDFHRFRNILSGDKQNEEDTTGAFGIGFTSVYQITDTPELVVCGYKLHVRPWEPEEKRIGLRKAAHNEGTLFRLPFAYGSTYFRGLLKDHFVPADMPDRLAADFRRILPAAILFLKHIRSVTLAVNGKPQLRVSRSDKGDRRIITLNDKRSQFLLLSSNVAVPDELAEYIAKRSPVVSIAIPIGSETDGLFYCTLPTALKTDLGFHVNGAFFAKMDRKSILLDELGLRSRWNKLIISTSAGLFAESLEQVRDALKPQRLWKVLDRLYAARENVQLGELGKAFWDAVSRRAQTIPLVPMSPDEWIPTSQAVIPTTEEPEILRLLIDLGINARPPELHSFYNVLRASGAKKLALDDLVNALARNAPASEALLKDCPYWMRGSAASGLGALFDGLYKGASSEQQAHAKRRLLTLTLAVDGQNRAGRLTDLRDGDSDTVALFETIGVGIRFANHAVGQPFAWLIPKLAVLDAAKALAGMPEGLLNGVLMANADVLRGLLLWFSERAQELLANRGGELTIFQRLPMAPCGSSMLPITSAAVPGNFSDPLNIAAIVDAEKLPQPLMLFLQKCGAKPLTIENYLVHHVMRVLEETSISKNKRLKLFNLVLSNIEEVERSPAALKAVGQMQFVECVDGKLHIPSRAFIDSADSRAVLGDRGPIAIGSDEAVRAQSLQAMGVRALPTTEDILNRISDICSAPPDESRVAALTSLCIFISAKLQTVGRVTPRITDFLARLRQMRWLPAKGDDEKWYMASEVNATFRNYLFPRATRFLGFERRSEEKTSEFLKDVGVEANPSLDQVAERLLECMDSEEKVHHEVYVYLNRHSETSEVQELRGKKCIWIDSMGYVLPSQVFWKNPFGPFRTQLAEISRDIEDFLIAVGVKDCPEAEDAISLLCELADTYGSKNLILEGDAQTAVAAAWRIVGSSASDESVNASVSELRAKRVVLGAQEILKEPRYCFFSDQPFLSAPFGTRLNNDLVPREEATADALLAAGVRRLSEVVVAEVEYASDEGENARIKDRLEQRRPHIKRLALITGNPIMPRIYDELVARIEPRDVEALQVRYCLGEFTLYSDWHAERSCLRGEVLFLEAGCEPPWHRIASAIAFEAEGEEQSCQRAAVIAAVLAAPSSESAREILDDARFPLFSESEFTELVAESTAMYSEVSAEPEGGTKEDETGEPESSIEFENELDSFGEGGNGESVGVEDVEAAHVSEPGVASETNGAATGGVSEKGRSGREVPGAISDAAGASPGRSATPNRSRSVGEASPEAAPRDPIGSGERGGGRRDGSGRGRRFNLLGGTGAKMRRSTRLISYVEENSDGAAAVRQQEILERRSVTSKAAVARVLAHECSEGRAPVEMDFYNVGYDIESTDGDGATRFIEVKGIEGAWTELGVGISSAQFESARERGAAWWLYVVPFATDDELAIVIPIQAPVQRITNYRFDRGWLAAAIPSAAAPKEPQPGGFVSVLGSEPMIIIAATKRGKLWSLVVESGATTKTLLFNPATMVLTNSPVVT